MRYTRYQLKSGEELNLQSISRPEKETLQMMLDDWQKHPYQNGEEFIGYWNPFVEQARRQGGRETSPLQRITEDLANRLEEKTAYGQMNFLTYGPAESLRSANW